MQNANLIKELKTLIQQHGPESEQPCDRLAGQKYLILEFDFDDGHVHPYTFADTEDADQEYPECSDELLRLLYRLRGLAAAESGAEFIPDEEFDLDFHQNCPFCGTPYDAANTDEHTRACSTCGLLLRNLGVTMRGEFGAYVVACNSPKKTEMRSPLWPEEEGKLVRRNNA